MFITKSQKGISLIEVVVCVAIFAVLSVSVYGIFTSIINGIVFFREGAVIASLADQYLEIVRNIPYSQIGTKQGNPHGPLADLPNSISTTVNGKVYQIYYAVSYVDDPADGSVVLGTDLAPNDYKQVKLYVKNVASGRVSTFLTNAVPKGLEGLATGGALSIKVIDSVGQPIHGATIHIVNTNISPNIDVTRISDTKGNWLEVGLPYSANSYRITATKSGYSVDRTYSITEQNPNPTKADATIANGQVTQISFSIDKLSNLSFHTLNQSCSAISGVGLEVRGAKLIGNGPLIYKFDNSYTSNSSGLIALNSIEFDNYTPALTEPSSYMVYGSSPIQQVNLLANTSQSFNIILGPKTDNSLLFLVKDGSTKNPVQGARVDLQYGENIFTGYSGGSIWSQQDWSGGSGQEEFSDSAKYYHDDGNINSNNILSGLRLAEIGNFYVSSGSLESSTFDTGTDSTSFTTLTWMPTSQDPATSIKFQIASNNDKTTWNYLGPDGTNQTYYDVSGTTINNANNKQYVRYKVFLSTTDQTKTPVLASVAINYISGCSAPGQVMFAGLEKGTGYQATISMPGSYQSQTITGIEIKNYNVLPVSLNQ